MDQRCQPCWNMIKLCAGSSSSSQPQASASQSFAAQSSTSSLGSNATSGRPSLQDNATSSSLGTGQGNNSHTARHQVSHTVNSLCNDCFVCPYIEKFVLTSKCPYSEGRLQSECSGWLPMALSLHRGCPYIKCPYNESLMYSSLDSNATSARSSLQHNIQLI